MNVDFKSMDGRKKKLYSALWGDFDFSTINAEIELTRNKKDSKPSHNSYCFSREMDKDGKLLMTIFGITDKELFKKQFAMAVTGSGQEIQKISTLHSSSLCALLHFYNVTDKNPLVLDLALSDLKTDNKRRTVKFTKSFFEYKSPVINKPHPSNMDVVLIGEDEETHEDIVFFLESKFSEYYLYASKQSGNISNKYLSHKFSKPLLCNFLRSHTGLQIVHINNENFKLVSGGEPFYIDGIKQMISHYTGIRNVLDKQYYEEKDPDNAKKQEKIEDVIRNGATLILGEIVFDNFIGDFELRSGLKCGAVYSQNYEILADEIGKLIKHDKVERFEILKKELGYSLFMKNGHDIEPKIRSFYREIK